MNKYGLRLKELREQNGYTQESLAKKLNTSRSRIGMYEQGKRQPDFEMQEAIADLFNVSIDYLFGRVDRDGNLTPYGMLYNAYVQKDKIQNLIQAYSKASPEIQKAVDLLLKADQLDS